MAEGAFQTDSAELSLEQELRHHLRVEGVSFRYAHFELASTSFEAHSGEVLAIIGPNGSGKSTLLEIVSGHLEPQAGKVTLDGADLHRLAPRPLARRVGLARQETILLFSFEVREFIRQGRHPHLGGSLFESPEDERWVDWAMEKTRLAEFAGRRVLEMSSAQRPQLVLLDEPTANLDIGYQIEMFRLLRNLAISERFIAVVVTHELNLASELADELILLERGRCLAKGTAEQVLQPDLLSRVFRTPILVDRNPSSGRPRVTWIATPA
jgi:iron complex transport system ATP-binding protein